MSQGRKGKEYMEQRILVIEDNPDISRVVQYELEQAGYEALTAPDGISGLTLSFWTWACLTWTAPR